MRVAPVDVALDPEGRVLLRHYRQPDRGHPCLVFTPGEWKALLFVASDLELEYWKIPAAACPVPLADALGDRLM